MATKLMKASYFDLKSETRLECYADTIVIEREGSTPYIAAIRLGGYPESVKGMADAIFGGGSITVEIDGDSRTLSSRVKRYRKEYAHDGIYAEATLMVLDEEQQQTDTENGENKGGNDDDYDSGNNSGRSGYGNYNSAGGHTSGGAGYADSGTHNAGGNNRGDDNSANAPRKCYIFCGLEDDGQLFEEVDKKTSVPLIPTFQGYVLKELRARGILKSLQVISCTEKFDAWALHMSSGEKNIISVVDDGLKSGDISIPGADADDFPGVYSVTGYLNAFGVQIAERIKEQFSPLFDPATEVLSPEVLAVNDYIRKNAGYSLYDAQLAVVEAHKRCLTKSKVTLCIAECGSGKSKIGTAALHAYQQRLTHRKPGSATHRKCFNIVLCPSHMAKKWVREIEETLSQTFATIVTSITELNMAYEAFKRDDKTCYVIITKERARDGYMRRPAVKWNQRRKAFLCPSCYEPIMTDFIDCGSKYQVHADGFFFRKETKHNHKCERCGSLLWTALVPEQQSEWVKVSDYGYVYRKYAYAYLTQVEKKPAVYEAIKAIADNPSGHFPNAGAYRRYPLSTYIKTKMRGKIDGLVVDELHQYNNNSGQGDAMAELFNAARKVIGLTATLINGYSSGIFHLLYRISPDLMLRDNKRYEKPLDFNDEYGVTETVYEVDAPDYNANRRTSKRKIRERQLPGVSPIVYSRFLMDSAAFLSLNDMGKDLPEYEEFPIQLDMNDDVAHEYNRIEGQFIDILKHQKDIAQKVLSAYLNLLTVYPDQPYGHDPVVHPITGDNLVVPRDTSSINELHDKDHHVLDIVERKTQEGGRVLVYTSWTRIDTQEKLTKLLTEQGYRVAVLTASVPPNKREEWVERQVSGGVQVLIANPSLVETGLDLNDFTTIFYYNISYNLFTLRQSSRRSWRINQRAPRVEVYFTYYEGTMQHRAIRLMASKLAVAGVIEGNLTDEGLAAMSDCQDMTTALARELTNGIEGEIEDLGAVFKRMALLKPESDVIEGTAVIVGSATEAEAVTDGITADDVVSVVAEPIPIAPTVIDPATQSAEGRERIKQPVQPSGLLSLLHSPKPKRTSKKKVALTAEGQLSLFDLLENTA